jgi:hypothetical protein
MTRSCMPGFFEAMANRAAPENKKHFVMVEGKQHEVTLDKKLWAQQKGEHNLMIQNGDIVLKPRPKPKTVYPVLTKVDKGYVFLMDDIHWPDKIQQGGVTWQIESE